MRILLVEDEYDLGQLLEEGLKGAGYRVDWARNGQDALDLALENGKQYSVIVLDIMLPKRDGWSVCEELRNQRNNVPILMMTARDAVPDRVRGLEMGADDYLPKPFDFRELKARIQALIRRSRANKSRVYRIADLEIDTSLRQVKRGDQEIYLTPREYALLEALAAHQGTVLTREVIQESVWGDLDSLSNTVDVHIGILRKKIDAGRTPKLIHTIHRQGYTLTTRDEEGGE